jgi:hypothetical protein
MMSRMKFVEAGAALVSASVLGLAVLIPDDECKAVRDKRSC